MSFVYSEDIPMRRYPRNIPNCPSSSSPLHTHRQKAVWQAYQPSQGDPIPQHLHRANNAPLDKNAIKLAEIPVFERCFKYGTSPDYIPKKIKETPEMIVSVKLYA